MTRSGFLLMVLMLASCRGEVMHELQGATMGTTWSARIVAAPGLDARRLHVAIEEELQRVDAQMSTWRADSHLSGYNRAPADTWHDLPDDLAHVLSAALQLAAATDGAFDPTVGPLVNLWGFGPQGSVDSPPTAQAIAVERQRVGWQRVHMQGQRVLQPGGVYLDVSAIGKGFAVDRMAVALEAAGVEHYLVEIGGEVRARGRRPDGSRWRIALESADDQDRSPTRIIELADRAVATSGNYRNRFDHEGRRYSHLIDPRNGRPVAHDLVAVTVIHDECMWADALATVLLVLGPEAGMAYAEAHGLAVVMRLRDGDAWRERVSSAFTALWMTNPR